MVIRNADSYHSLHWCNICIRMPMSPATMRLRIAEELQQFLARHPIKRVMVAEGSLPPPSLAYMVSFPRISVTLSGQDRVEMEQGGTWRTVRAERGDAILVPANIANRPTWTGRSKVLTILFGARHTGISLVPTARAGGIAPTALKAQINVPAESPCRMMLSALTSLVTSGADSPACRSLVEAILHCSSSLLDQAPSDLGSKASRTYQSLCLYAQEHFHQPLTRESIADQFRLSPNHVSRLFRQQGLMTFGDYLNWVRIDRAKLLLRRHDFSLDAISARCGFNQVSYFCRVFKARTKMTPTQYRLSATSQALAEPHGLSQNAR